jgi:intracellular sulfur oxidation DsrE/DsrF family protein
MKRWVRTPLAGILLALFAFQVRAAAWPAPKAPAIPEADGYIQIPGAALPPVKTGQYRAIFDATRAADQPGQLVPAINMAGSELNAFAVAGVPKVNVHFALVFHGAAMSALLDDAHYRAKFGTANPNLKPLAAMKRAGVEIFVCGQNLAFDKVDPKALAPEVTIASDALIVLMAYQAKGYALLFF